MKQIIIAIFCLLSVKGYSQISLAYSGKMGTFSFQALMPVNDGSYISFKTVSADTKGKSWNTYRKSVSFVKYDKDFKQVNEVKMTASEGICSGEYYELKKAGNKFWFIYLVPGENNQVGNIKAVEIDAATLQQNEEKTLVSAAAINHTLRDYRYTMYFDFIFGTSPTGKYNFLCIQLSNDDSYLASFDDNLKPLWEGKNKKEEGEIYSVEIDDAGYLYMGVSNKKDNVACSVWSPSGQVSNTMVNIAEGKARGIIFHPAKGSDNVTVTGTYMEDDNCTGVYKGIINKKGVISKIVTTAFPKNIVESMDKEGFASTKAKKYGVNPSFCATSVRNSEGNSSMSMMMEFRREAGGGATGVTTNLLGGSLIYVDFANATPVFARVPKYSVSGKLLRYSYNAHYRNVCLYNASLIDSKLVVLYFDNPDNLNRNPDIDAKVVNPKNQEMVAAVVSKDGTMKRQQVTVNTLNTSGMPQATGTVVLLPVYIDDKNAIVTVKL